MDQHQMAFKEEAYELLSDLEALLLDLEACPDDMELINSVFRSMHTIKGSGAMFGFEDIAVFTHEVETVYDEVRSGAITVSKHLIDLTLSACDCIGKMLDGGEIDDTRKSEIENAFQQISASDGRVQEEDGKPDGAHPFSDGPATYRIRFRPVQELFSTGTNPVLLLDELRQMGKSHVVAHTRDIPDLKTLHPESCFLFWDIILTTTEGVNAIRDVFIFVEDMCELSIDLIDEEGDPAGSDEIKRLGEILVDRGDATVEDLQAVLKDRKKIGELLVEARVVDKTDVDSALAEQAHVKQLRWEQKNTASAASIRVSAGKLDKLVDLVGEMVTVQARLSQEAFSRNESTLVAIAEEVERLTGELRDNTMSIRMVPIGMTFSRFKRLVRDLSEELGKEVRMTTEGGETELDKTVIDRLNDPLVHIIRNSIDHGIESPDKRTAGGKSAVGTVHLSASHSGANVIIRISDDGAGLDAAAIRSKAVEKGLVQSDEDVSENEIFQTIFAAGFSTATEITNVSGRGVGMDVVKRSIESLRGSIDVESIPDKGTTIVLKLPLTLAIIDGFMVQVGDGYYVLPLSTVEECVELPASEKAIVNTRKMMNVRGEVVPYQSLRDLFCIHDEKSDDEKIIIVETGGRRIGFGVDKVIGQHQTVIKTLGRAYKNVNALSGATIMGDGTVALVLDVDRLFNMAA